MRYYVCLLLLTSQGLGQWCQLYSSGLTRAKRVFFDEFNVLKTYQPRARTMGYLFMPEPPTPVPECQRSQESNQSNNERNVFLQTRDAHYANEYAYVQKVNRELESNRKLIANSREILTEHPKIEGPVLIEFRAQSEEDDDDYSL
ncbi:unnamed protein product [Thelazia callipaeda]|uniref:Uncharacterized protein n=1 Tax=Thelazia callipaeda TaxID=103827 RepID=A0A0N5D062_THECL|nr:unnamed protein product [Thelazia callipaeda]